MIGLLQRVTGARVEIGGVPVGEIGRGLQRIPQVLAQPRLLGEIANGVEAGFEHRNVRNGTGNAARQLARTRRCDRSIDRRQQTACPRSLV